MLEIYKVAPVLKNYPLDIECVFAYDCYLLVGTRQGHLLMYKLAPKLGNELKFDVDLLRSNKSFAKKPIIQIAAVPEFHIIISLSDNVISVHGLDHVFTPLITSIAKTKGATLFVIDVQKWRTLTGEHQSALRMCVVVKKRLLLFYWKNNDFLELAADLILNDTPKVIAWCSESLCVGFRTEYSLIKVTGEVKELFPTGKPPEPNVVALEGNKLALGRDQNTYIFDDEGSPILKYPISWSDPPLYIVDDYPYLLAMLPSSVIEVRTVEPRLFVQSVTDLSLNSSNRMKQIVKCLNKKGMFFVSSAKDIYCLQAVPIQQQIPQLLREEQFDLALTLADMCEDKEDLNSVKKETTKRHIENLQAFHKFCHKEFSKAMELFLKLETDPSQVIGLFPDLLPDDFRSRLDYPCKPPEFKGADLENGIFALIDFLLLIRHKLNSKDSSSSGAAAAATAAAESTEAANKSSNSSPIKGYSKSKDQLRQIVDTTLLKCYLQTNDALVSSLLRVPDNYCHLEETEIALKRHHKYNEVIILYQSKGLHHRALDLLQKQSRKPDSPLYGHERMIQYLQHLGKENLDLIFEYAKPLLQEHPEDGLRIFTEDLSETADLPREVVLDYLQKVNPDTVVSYLEHIIWNWKDTTLLFHNTLANKYREKVRVLLEEYRISLPEGQPPAAAGEEPGELGQLRAKLINFLEKSDYYSTETLPFFLLNDGLWEERAVVMGKIGNHEEALTIYVHVLNDPKKAENYCVRVFNKSEPGNRDVYLTLLKLYILTPDLSSTSCSTEEAASRSAQQNLNAAFDLLKHHATEIDPLRALLLLPQSTSIEQISTFLVTVTSHLGKERREGQIFRNLLLAQHLSVQSQRVKLHQENKVLVDEVDACTVCTRKIGRSAFLRYPNKDMVHYSCKDRYNLIKEASKF